VPLGKAEVEAQIAALDIAQSRQPLAKKRHDRLGIGRRVDQQHADERCSPILLRERGEGDQ
jgi:hypothetical protein